MDIPRSFWPRELGELLSSQKNLSSAIMATARVVLKMALIEDSVTAH
jgi:hypothetical protein